MQSQRKLRQQVALGIHDQTVAAGDHLALFYESDSEFAAAFAFIDTGINGGDHCILFGIPEDTARMAAVLQARG